MLSSLCWQTELYMGAECEVVKTYHNFKMLTDWEETQQRETERDRTEY